MPAGDDVDDVDTEAMAYFRELCARLRAYRDATPGVSGRAYPRPPASDERLRAVEAAIGFPLPPLLRLLYREVADGGPGLIDDYEELVASADLAAGVAHHPTGWRLHPCIERALQHYQLSFVQCAAAALPDRFIRIGPTGHCDLLLDARTGWIYQGEYNGVLPPRRKGERIDLYALSFCRRSLWELCEEWLERVGYGQPHPAAFRVRQTVPAPPPARWGELTPELLDPTTEQTPELIWRRVDVGGQPKLLDPACADDPARIWEGLYPGAEPILWSAVYTGVDPYDELEEKVARYVPPGGWPDEETDE